MDPGFDLEVELELPNPNNLRQSASYLRCYKMNPEDEIKPQHMQRRSPAERCSDFEEVALGYTEDQARLEARRCLQCAEPACVEGCPVRVDIPGFIAKIVEGDYLEAGRVIKQTNILPSICGRVCPQENQCQERCVLANQDKPISIGALERFAGDYSREQADEVFAPAGDEKSGRVAVVGSGPAGLTCAADLLRLGHEVTVYEAFHEPGGVLVYGIPQFRLPNEIVRDEVENLREMGAEIKLNVLVGRTVTVDELLGQQGFDAVFIGAGAGTPLFLNIPGENLPGIYSANEFLTRVNLMRAYREDFATPLRVGNRVAVIGGGNVALDSARSALRTGADHVQILYRRSREQMPARQMEIEHAEQEGIDFQFLTNPVRFLDSEKNKVTAVECQKMKLGEPDDSGRPRPLPVEASNHQYEVDTVVVAIGSRPNRLLGQTTEDLETDDWNTVEVDEETGETTKDGVFAGGDVTTGSATVIAAMGAARRSARAIDTYIKQN